MTSGVRAAAFQRVAAVLHRMGGTHLLARAAAHVRRNPGFPILSYHRVNDDLDPFLDSLPTEVFEQHMAHIAQNYRVLTVEELAERLRREEIPTNALAITFDDGSRDTLTHAAPILSRYRLPATVFLATGFIGTADVPWYDQVTLAFKLTKQQTLSAPWGALMSLATTSERLAAVGRALAHLKRVSDEERRRTVDILLRRLGITDRKSFKNSMLTWDDVHALAGLGFSIGAHTVSHPILSRVTPDRAWREIQDSRAMIESACGSPPRAFAYPNGQPADYSTAVAQMVREAGFHCAVTTCFGINTRATSPWELRRGGPWEYHPPTFALKLAWYRMTLP